MCSIKTVFIDNQGDLNFNGRGEVCTLNQLIDWSACYGDKFSDDMLKLADGCIYQWSDNFNDEECYVKLEGIEKTVYDEFLQDLDPAEEILSIRYGDLKLEATTTLIVDRNIYLYSYTKCADGTIDKQYMYLSRSILETALTV